MAYTQDDDPQAPVEEHRFPCEQCGADLRFDPERGGLSCDHCGFHSDIPPPDSALPAIKELDFRAGLDAALPQAEMEDTRATSCPNCGAQVRFDAASQSEECPFCATPVVADTGSHRQIKPRGVVPFQLDEPAARHAMTDWLGRLWFAPNGLREYARNGRRMTGIYTPYWTFDADTKSSYTGQRGDAYYVTKTVVRDGKNVQVRERRIRWSPKRGRVARFFDDVLVLAARSLPKKYTDNLAPWELSALEPYRPDFLAGFAAEGYTVELEDGYEEARAHMDRVILRDVRFDIGGDEQRVFSIDTLVSAVTFKHILLPVWMAAYKYRGKTYRFVVNGQTGKVQGERPWSAWKIAIAVTIVVIIAGVVGYFVAQNQ